MGKWTRLDGIELYDSPGGGGWWHGSWIGIGSGALNNQESFEQVTRHEVGHAVQSKLDQAKKNLVSNWLKEQFGWQAFGLDDSGIDAWVNLMGGYGNITAQQQAEVRKYLRDSSKQQPQPPNVPSDHPWNASNFGPRLALEQTGDPLWDNYRQWYRANGLGFYRDYDYGLVTAVNESTFDFVEQMPSSYALRSPFEFFAELYALFYNLADSRWGNIPQNLRDWLWDNVGSAMPIPGKYYMLRNKQSRQVIGVRYFSKKNSADVVQFTGEDDADNQQWLLEDMGNGYYTLTAKHSGKALNVRGASTQDGAQIEQSEKNGTDAQQWELEETEDGYYILLSKASGMALTVSGDEAQNEAPIQQQTNQESDIQKWRFEPSIGKRILIGPFGGTGGGRFQDSPLPDGAKICKVRIRHGSSLDAIGLSYKLNGQITDLPMHGGNGGTLSEFAIEDDEYITSLSGRYERVVNSLVIQTNKRTSSQYGGNGGSTDYKLDIQYPKQELIGFLGRSGSLLDAIGIVLVDIDKRILIGPFGGTGGGRFKDSPLPDGAKICKVRIRHGSSLDAIGLSYKLNGQITDLPMHGGNGGTLSEFAIEDDEYITSLSGRYERVVNSLVIQTNKRTSSQYGGNGGSTDYKLDIQYPKQELVGFLGRSGLLLDAIGIVLVDKGA